MKFLYSMLTLLCLSTTAATAATFPSAYEPRRSTDEEGLQILGPPNYFADGFGSQVSPLGDINGDSLMDFAIGWGRDPLEVFLIYGNPSLASTQVDMPSIVAAGTLMPKRIFATGVGDFNGDGFDDWIMSSYDIGAKLILGRSNAYPIPLDVTQLDRGQWVPITTDGIGYSYSLVSRNLIPAGDINGDGYDDILAWRDNEHLVILHGRSGRLPDRLELSEAPENLQSTVQLGFLTDAHRGGDINGDGFADVMFPAFSDLHVVFGSATGLPGVIDVSSLNGENGFSIVSDEYEDEADRDLTRGVVGYLSRIVDDITGDGVDDLLVASSSNASSTVDKVQLLTGHEGSWNAEITLLDLEVANAATYEASNICGPVRSAGDINADGINDWLVDICEEFSVVYGREKTSEVLSLNRMDGINGFRIKPTARSDGYDQASSANGDVNGDGIDDLLLSSPQAFFPVSNLDELIDRPYPWGDSDQTGLVNVVFGRPELGDPASPNALYPALGPDFIQLRWELALQQQASEFEVRRDGVLIATVSGNATGYVDSTTQRDVRHTYEVITIDDAGVRSSPLVLSTKNDLARYPEISGAVYSSNRAEVFWVFDNLNYDIFRDGELVDSANVSSWLDREYDSSGHTYYVEAEMQLYQQHRVRSALLTLPGYVGGRPPAPVDNLQLALYSSTTLELFWDHASWGEAPLVYEINRNGDVVATVAGTSWMDYNINPRSGYSYTLTTIDANGRRSRAQSLSVSTYEELPKIRPTMPVKLSASVLENTSIALTWVRSSIGTLATGFKIYRDGIKVGTTTETRFVDSKPTVNTSYKYEVIAYNDVGQKSEPAYLFAGVFALVPPENASAIAYSSLTVEVFWSRVPNFSVPAARYELYRNGSLIDTLDALSYMDRNVMPGTTYEYSIRSVSALGLRSDEAVTVSVTTP